MADVQLASIALPPQHTLQLAEAQDDSQQHLTQMGSTVMSTIISLEGDEQDAVATQVSQVGESPTTAERPQLTLAPVLDDAQADVEIPEEGAPVEVGGTAQDDLVVGEGIGGSVPIAPPPLVPVVGEDSTIPTPTAELPTHSEPSSREFLGTFVSSPLSIDPIPESAPLVLGMFIQYLHERGERCSFTH